MAVNVDDLVKGTCTQDLPWLLQGLLCRSNCGDRPAVHAWWALLLLGSQKCLGAWQTG